MRVIVWTAGNGDAGIGHLTRCQALVPALLRRGAQVQVIAQADISLESFIHVEGAQTRLVPDRDAALSALKSDFIPGILLADRPDLTAADSKAHYATGAKRIVLLASSRIAHYPSDIAIIDDPVLAETGTPLAGWIETGAHLHMVRPEMLALRPSEPVILPGNSAKLLIALSGSDPGGLTEPLVEALCGQAGEAGLSLHLTVLIGAGWAAARRAAFLRNAPQAIEILDAPETLGPAICASGAVVTLGGRTTYEAFYLGRPALCVPWQTTARYARALGEQGLALVLDSNVENAVGQILGALTNPASLNANAARAFKIVDPGAADRVAAICLDGTG